MDKTIKKALTLDDLIKKKEDLLKNKQTKTALLHVKRLDGNIRVKMPEYSLAKEIYDMESDEGNAYLLYECVIEPNLKATELQEAYECVEPMEIVHKIFEWGEITSISQELLKLAGYGDGVKLIKNS